MCGVTCPASVSMPSLRPPAANVNWHGSRASCGTGYGLHVDAADRQLAVRVQRVHAHESEIALAVPGVIHSGVA